MNQEDLRALVIEELGKVAPEADLSEVDPEEDLRQALDIDSLDLLNYVIALHQRTGIDIPERDYPKLTSIEGAIHYLSDKSAGSEGG